MKKLDPPLSAADIGRKFKTRRGDVVTIEEFGDDPGFPARCSSGTYMRDGSYIASGFLAKDDLVERLPVDSGSPSPAGGAR